MYSLLSKGSLRFWTAGLCLLIGLGLWTSPSAGQMPKKAPPADQNKPVVQPRNPQSPPADNSPIIQSPPGTAQAAVQPEPGESAPSFTDSDALTLETVKSRLKEVTEDPGLEQAEKDRLTALYQQATTDLTEAAKLRSQAAEFAQKTQTMPSQIEEAEETKEELAKPPKVTIPKDASLSELQQELQAREEALSNAKTRLDEAVNALKSITATRAELSQNRKTAEDRLAETEQKLKNLPANGEATPQVVAERTQLRARWQYLKARLDQLTKEEAWQNARKDLLPLQRDIAALQAERLEEEVKIWRDAVTAARQAELDREKAEAEKKARQARTFEKYPSIAEHANRVVQLAERRQETAEKIPQVIQQLDETTKRRDSIQENFKQSRERVAAAGNTMNVGTLLRLEQKKLPDTRALRQNIEARQEEIQTLQLATYEVSDRAKELSPVTTAAEELIDSLDPPPDGEERKELLAFVKELLETERSHLDSLNADYNDLLEKLYALDKVEKQLIEETKNYSQFITEHVLWIRSCEPIWEYPFSDYENAVSWLLHAEDWASVLSAIGNDFWESPGPWIVFLAVFGFLFIQQPKMRRQISEIGKNINKRAMTEFLPTLRVLLFTILIAGLWPAALCWLGYRLRLQLNVPVSVTAVGSALFAMGVVFFPLELLRQCCRTNGLVQAHFTWPAPVVTMIRRNLRWFKVFTPPFALVAAIFIAGRTAAPTSHESLGRLCFCIALLLVSWFMHRVLRPSGSLFRSLEADKHGWINRLKHVCYIAGVLVPVTLACLAIVGFYYTAGHLVVRFFASAVLTLVVLILDALIIRWLLVARRRIAVNQLRQRRESALAQQAAAQKAAGGAPLPPPSSALPNPADVEDERLDVNEMNDQTRQLVRSLLLVGVLIGIWGVWVDVLPALAILKKVEIHTMTMERVVEEPASTATETAPPSGMGPVASAANQVTADASAETAPETVKQTVEVPITLADLILSVIILVVAFAAARNLPGMLEMIVLQRLPMDNAARYAVSTLAQYALTIIGITMAFHVIGIRWQNVQWLAAALMLGLGFGLQEIFANFFSGLIVLLERPIRVGDVVTVGETTGIVTKIRMRASTITDWDRHEMIIPNKDLITGTVLNWTLSDTVQRVFIPIGLAYGSDTEKATKTLYEVITNHPRVMKDPAPLVTFAGFGDSTLNFEVRCFIPNFIMKLDAMHELHQGIDNAFRKAGLEIAFPQRDLHIRSVDKALPFQHVSHGANGQGERPQEERTQNPAISEGV